jgi:biotin carboxyl carrier protein
MPGKVVRILMDEGAEVEAQQGVLVVEAMKMQNGSRLEGGRVAELRVVKARPSSAGGLGVIE